MYSLEFFNQRSFEVVWAVFRVAEYVSHPKLRQTLEDRALDYFVFRNGVTLDTLEETVRLAANIGQIGKTNAGVLLRETANLRAALLELKERGIAVGAGNAQGTSGASDQPSRKEEPSIDGIFSRPPMLLADFMGMVAQSMGSVQGSAADAASAASEDRTAVSAHPEAVHENPATVVYGSGNDSSSIYIDKNLDLDHSADFVLNESGKESGNAANENNVESAEKPAINAVVSGAQKRNPAMSAQERQAMIIEQLSRKTYSTLKDVADGLPKVSERTLRYDIGRMVEKKIVERVGGGGPHSFIRLKKGKSTGK